MGSPSRGWLVRGHRLPLEGRHHRVVARAASRGYIYGTDELVSLLLRAADRVAAASPGAVLEVADLSRRGGGDIPQSVTHNSGRDADVAFFARDAAGRPARNAEFTPFDTTGKAGNLTFDVARNWEFVKAVLTDPAVRVQGVLVARWLRALLLEHAARTGEPSRVIQRAQAALRQPRRAAAHDDHFHLRVHCAPHELAAGCTDAGRGPRVAVRHFRRDAGRRGRALRPRTDPRRSRPR